MLCTAVTSSSLLLFKPLGHKRSEIEFSGAVVAGTSQFDLGPALLGNFNCMQCTSVTSLSLVEVHFQLYLFPPLGHKRAEIEFSVGGAAVVGGRSQIDLELQHYAVHIILRKRSSSCGWKISD